MKTLVIIDGKSVFYRGYYAMGHLSLEDGTPTGGVYGFAVIGMEIVKRLKPDKVVVAWDKAKTSTRKRKKIYAEYKAGRAVPPEDFFVQIPYLRELVADLGWDFVECDDYEADDIIGTLAKQAKETGEWETVVVSSDMDMMQVVDERVKVWRLMKGFSVIEEMDVAAVEKNYGVRKEQFLDLKALKGDVSDNIPGVLGVGEKTAVQLLKEYGSLAEIYASLEEDFEGRFEESRAEDGQSVERGEVAGEGGVKSGISGAVRRKLLAGRESAWMSWELARIMTDAPVVLAEMRDYEWDERRVKRGLLRLGFANLVRKYRLEGVEVGEEDEMRRWDEVRGGGEVQKNDKVRGDGRENYASGDIKNQEELILEWDVKGAMHRDEKLAEAILQGKKFYDLGQGEFLLNPLIRNASKVEERFGSNYASGDIKEKEYLRQREEFMKYPKLKRLFLEMDLPLIPVLFKMERKGMGISREGFGRLEREIRQEVEELMKEIFEMVGYEFNLNSPMQLSEALFDKMGLPTKGVKKKQRFYSTGAGELAKLLGESPVIEKIMEYREKSKLLSTYIGPLPKLADEQGRIHTTFTQNVTATGRLSSVAPNLQNIPVRTEEGRRIREGFVAGEGKVLVSADYAQFELRLAAVLAGEEGLVGDFNADVDIHKKTAAEVFGVKMEEVTERQRRAAKMVNFGVLYGITAMGLSEATEMSVGEAKKFIEEYFGVRKKVREFMDETLRQAREEGYVETFYGRRRPTPDVKAANFMVRAGAERAAMNMPIQGTAADLMKRAMIRVDAALPGGADLVCQVHDSLMVECDEGLAGEVEAVLRREMEGVAPELGVRLAVDVKVGKNWGEV